MKLLNSRAQSVSARFRCPECKPGDPLAQEDDAGHFVCTGCGATYPILNGVPLLLSREGTSLKTKELGSSTGTAMVAEYGDIAAASNGNGHGKTKKWIDYLRPPDVMYHVNPDLQAPETRSLFTHRGPDTKVLNVGGGPHRYYDNEITLNLEVFFNVDIVGDAHNIPFLDDTFDSILCNAVLEHVHNPEGVVSEMERVLKPGGYLYAEVPFIFFFHGYPNDFQRYTLEGMRHLFGALEDPHFAITNGPVSAMLQSFNRLFQMMLPARVPYLRKGVNGVYRWIVFPLKYLDLIVNRSEEAAALAGGFSVLGRKPAPTGPNRDAKP